MIHQRASTLSKRQENVRIIHAVLDRVQTLTIASMLIFQIPLCSATLPRSASAKFPNSATRDAADATSGQGAERLHAAGVRRLHQKKCKRLFRPFSGCRQGQKGRKPGRVAPSRRHGLNLPKGCWKGSELSKLCRRESTFRSTVGRAEKGIRKVLRRSCTARKLFQKRHKIP
jgi:hypothetical protein